MTQGAKGFNPAKWAKNLSAKQFVILCRFLPPIRRSGVRIQRLSEDWLEWDVTLPLTYRTRNYVGTHYGGTMYSAADPFLMLSYLHLLDCIVWDKAAAIRFKRPGLGTLHMAIRIDPEEVESIRAELATKAKFDRTYTLYWCNQKGDVVAEVDKTLHFRRSNS